MLPRARQEQLVIQQVADELLVYSTAEHRLHRLNRTTALIWRHCNGRTTVPELAELLARELGLPSSERVARLALDQLDRAGLLRKRVPRMNGERLLTRRQAVAAGFAGAMLLLLPGCESMTAPGARPEVRRRTASDEEGCRLTGSGCEGACDPGRQCETNPTPQDGRGECVCDPTAIFCEDLPPFSMCEGVPCRQGGICSRIGAECVCPTPPVSCDQLRADECGSGSCSGAAGCIPLGDGCECACPFTDLGPESGLVSTGVEPDPGQGDGYVLAARPKPAPPPGTPPGYFGPSKPFATARRSPLWANPPAGSSWIGPCDPTERDCDCGVDESACSDLPGVYPYRLTFALRPELDPKSAFITGRLASDNVCTVFFNGRDTHIRRGPEAFTQPTEFRIDSGNGEFRTGKNTILFIVTNLGGSDVHNPSGLLVADIHGSVRPKVC
jgi:hypothetical protein